MQHTVVINPTPIYEKPREVLMKLRKKALINALMAIGKGLDKANSRIKKLEEVVANRDQMVEDAYGKLQGEKEAVARVLAPIRRDLKSFCDVVGAMQLFAQNMSENTAESYPSWEMMRVMLGELEEQLDATIPEEKKSDG